MRAAIIVAAFVAALSFAGCLDEGSKKGVRPEDIPYMVDKTKGAITGVIVNKDDRPVDNLKVQLFDQQDEVLCQVETQYDGKFYCPKLWPGTYRIHYDLKDWPDCSKQVYAGKFSNITIKQYTYSPQGRAGGCLARP